MDFFKKPPQWKEYFTSYPNGFSLMEMLSDWASKANILKKEVDNKTDLTGDHKGTWHGLNPKEVEQAIPELIDKLEEDIRTSVILPEMYGAVGDGESDDTVPIQQAINNTKGVVLLTSHYKVSQTINIPSNINVEFRGGSIISTINSGEPVIKLFNVVNVNIINPTINGNNLNTTAILIQASTNCNIFDGKIENVRKNGVLVSSNSKNCNIKGSTFFNCMSDPSGLDSTIAFSSSSNSKVVGVLVYQSGSKGIAASVSDHIIIDSCLVENTVAHTGDGLYCQTCDFIIFKNNLVRNASGSGLKLSTGSKECVVENNKFINTRYDGVRLQGCSESIVSGNILLDIGSYGTSPASGIFLQRHSPSNTTSYKNIITANHIKKIVRAGILVYSGAGDSNVITNNFVESANQRTGEYNASIQINTNHNTIANNTAKYGNLERGGYRGLVVNGTNNVVTLNNVEGQREELNTRIAEGNKVLLVDTL